jgi:nucleotide-binding universal stress UspA family protein
MEPSAGLGTGRAATVVDAVSTGSWSRPAAGHERVPVGAKGVPDEINLLILATDLTAVSEGAADAAIGLAVEHRAILIVMSVVDPKGLRMPGGRFLRRVDQERTRVEAGAQEIVRRARAAGARATFLVWEGDPADAILSASESERADVIVLGSHDRGRLGRLVLGSISARVAANARCGVLVVPREGSAAGD